MVYFHSDGSLPEVISNHGLKALHLCHKVKNAQQLKDVKEIISRGPTSSEGDWFKWTFCKRHESSNNLMYAACIRYRYIIPWCWMYPNTHIYMYIYIYIHIFNYIYNMPCISILCKVCRAAFWQHYSPNQPLVPWLPSRDMSWVSRAFPWNEKSVSRNLWRPRAYGGTPAPRTKGEIAFFERLIVGLGCWFRI